MKQKEIIEEFEKVIWQWAHDNDVRLHCDKFEPIFQSHNQALSQQREEFKKTVKKIQAVEPESNGRYNACSEMLIVLSTDIEKL